MQCERAFGYTSEPEPPFNSVPDPNSPVTVIGQRKPLGLGPTETGKPIGPSLPNGSYAGHTPSAGPENKALFPHHLTVVAGGLLNGIL